MVDILSSLIQYNVVCRLINTYYLSFTCSSSLHIQLTDPTLMRRLMNSHRSYELHIHDYLEHGFFACSDPDEIEARDIPR